MLYHLQHGERKRKYNEYDDYKLQQGFLFVFHSALKMLKIGGCILV